MHTQVLWLSSSSESSWKQVEAKESTENSKALELDELK
jgi:hypothetical protein